MRFSRMTALLAAAFLAVTAAAVGLEQMGRIPFEPVPNEVRYVRNECIVVMAAETAFLGTVNYQSEERSGAISLDRIAAAFEVERLAPQFPGAAERGIDALARHYKVRFSTERQLEAVMAAYAADPLVERVEPIGIHPVYAMPNDGFFSDQWHLDQTSDHDIDAPEAWDIETGDPAVIVAILDTGVRYYHKDLGGVNASAADPGAARGNMWINWSEKNGTAGVDDDGNGYVDDWVGYDFVDGGSNCWSGEDCNVKDNDPRDFNGHGTHCAGNVAAINNNGYATCAPTGGWGNGTLEESGNGVKVMACRVGWSGSYFGQEVGYVRMDFCAEGFYYAADNGAKIASCSWGSSNSGGVGDAVTYFISSGGMVFKAAGNDGGQTADYLCGRSDVISVAATDENDCKASFSTYGTWVDISAPGVNVMSLYHAHGDPTGDYVATMSGTSMAAPLAASVAAIIWSQNPGWTPAQVGQRLYDTADDIYGESCNSAYAGKLGAGRINAHAAVSGGTPPPVADFTGSPTSGCVPLTVAFTDASTGDIDSWSWTFGDGGTSSAQSPSYEYPAAGTYTVGLTVTGPGGSDTETKSGYIAVGDVPVADFSGSPTSGTAPLTVSFTDLSSGNPASWSWVFGDGGTSNVQNPTHQYTAEGDFTVTLTASNACGEDVATKAGYIHVDPPQPYATALSDIPFAGTVTGSYSDTHVSDDVYEVITEVSSETHPRKWYSMLEHRWDFSVAAGAAIIFRVEAYRPANSDGDDFAFEYSTDGSAFTRLVTVSSAAEQVYTADIPSQVSGTVYIRVVDTDHTRSNQSLDAIYIDHMVIESSSTPLPPVAQFSATPTSGSAPLTVQFTDLSSGAPTSWSWTFGDDGVSTAQDPAYEYMNPGTYTVSLTATNTEGSDTETKDDYITVYDPGSATIHVHDMVVTRKIAGPNHSGRCTVWIYDAADQPVSGASVTVEATGPTSGTYTGTTLQDGTATFTTAKIKNPQGEWCFEVLDVTHPIYTYDPAANNVTRACESGDIYGESSGGAIALSLGHAVVAAAQRGGTISFALPGASRVQLDLINVAGQRVATLAQGWHEPGRHVVELPTSEFGSGVYFVRLRAGEVTLTRRWVVVR